MKQIHVLIILLIASLVSTPICTAAELNNDWEWGKWRLDELIEGEFNHKCEAVIVGRLVPIELPGKAGFGDDIKRDYYLIISDSVLYGDFERCCLLQVPENGIQYIDSKTEESLLKDGFKLTEGHFARALTRDPYLMFLYKKEGNFNIPIVANGLCIYGVVNGLNGIIGLDHHCLERRSRNEIARQYKIDMDEFTPTSGLTEQGEHADAFINVVKFYCNERKRAYGLTIEHEIVLSETEKSLYDTLVFDKPMPSETAPVVKTGQKTDLSKRESGSQDSSNSLAP